jgi:hypothetical protein
MIPANSVWQKTAIYFHQQCVTAKIGQKSPKLFTDRQTPFAKKASPSVFFSGQKC